jgi:hypothetical protein
MTIVCPECGAQIAKEGACQSLFEAFLALDYTDPGYGAVHPLTVSCFMIQHGRYSDEALVWIQEKIRMLLDDNLTGEQLRSLAKQDVDNQTRSWKVIRQTGSAPVPSIAWKVTIADVAAHSQDAESYRHWVKEWARETLDQMSS